MPVSSDDAPPKSYWLSRAEETKATIKTIAEKWGVTYEQVLSKSRAREIMFARCEAIRAIRAIRPQMSLPQIGRVFRRDHTSILYHVNHQCACDKHKEPAR